MTKMGDAIFKIYYNANFRICEQPEKLETETPKQPFPSIIPGDE